MAGIGGQYADLVFTAPAAGTYSLAASFIGSQVNIGTYVGIVANGSIVFSSSVTSEGQTVPFNYIVSLEAGNTVVFSVGPDNGLQNTGLSLTITGNSCDITGDTTTTVSDVQAEINEALGAAPTVNDVNGDGVINVVDVQIVINAALNLGCTTSNLTVTGTRPLSHLRPPFRPFRPIHATSLASGGNFDSVGLPYNLTDLGTLGGSSATAYGVNNRGQVVGISSTGEFGPSESACGGSRCPINHAFLWEAGRMTDLSVPGNGDAVDSGAFSINDTSLDFHA